MPRSQRIFALQGSGISEIDPLNFRLAVSNLAFNVEDNELKTRNDASVAAIGLKGYVPRLVASIKPDLQNINQTQVRVAYAQGFSEIPSQIPPGIMHADCPNDDPQPGVGVDYPCYGHLATSAYLKAWLPGTTNANTSWYTGPAIQISEGNWAKAAKSIISNETSQQ
jgi:hypothetical protein